MKKFKYQKVSKIKAEKSESYYDFHDSHKPGWLELIWRILHHKHSHNDKADNEPLTDYSFRNIDGSDNNPNYSAAGQDFLRIADSDYQDGFDSPSGTDRPSAREISNELFTQTDSLPASNYASDLFWLWGQFIDHDITLTKESELHESFNIKVPLGDVYFDPYFTGVAEISLTRSGFNESTGGEHGVPRQQVNEITAFIDASMVYGSDDVRNLALRNEDGTLKTSAGDLLPFNTDQLPNAGGPSSSLFLAGDVRANENVALTSLHTLFVREHNRLVEELKQSHPGLDGESYYQHAKVLVEAEIQAITYREFLPQLLGENALPDYQGYNPDVDPEIANLFATAAFRIGHTMLSAQLERVDEMGNESEYGHLSLRDAFFRPDVLINQGGIDDLLRGVAEGRAESLDMQMIDDVRNFLFGPPGSGGFDLASLNIQRGRDHGLPDYNSAREAYGLEKVTSFAEITSDILIQTKLAELFGDVDNIDVFVGGLAEDSYQDSMLGELFHTIVLDQFIRLRDGDQYFFSDRLSAEDLDFIDSINLSTIIVNNTDIDYLQQNVMQSYLRIAGTDGKDTLTGTEHSDLMIGFDGKDRLSGLDGNDELYGGKGNDVLKGGKGNDRLIGEKGNDKLHGDEGNDTFVFGNNFGRDYVYDFNQGDQLDLSAFNISFDELNIRYGWQNTVIKVPDDPGNSIVLLGVNDPLSDSDFIF